ncbi:MAG: S8 family peptidase, partial [Bacteroidota bacterium]
SVIICLLDSGVNNKHPLLTTLLPDSRMFSYKAAWGTNDSWPLGGHGTPIAGLATYGDLVQALSSINTINIYHGLESFKIIHPHDPNDPAFYGSITEYAVSTPIVDFPSNQRVYCLAITDRDLAFKGRPSSWSAAIDKIANGSIFDPQAQQLLIVSSGNVDYLNNYSVQDYPDKNHLESIHDPAQAYNALTIGGYTRMDRIDQTIWQNTTPLAPNGGMSPCNSTSVIWENQWPIKPDLVFEAGNVAVQGAQLRDDVHSLKPLSTDKEFLQYLFYPFGDTSGAAALASKMAAELKTANPTLWPETIRGLLVHSAEWTDVMLNGISFENATNNLKRLLLRTYGYGVPLLEKALYSASNSLTLISENIIQPYISESSSIKYNEYHLYKIPWPSDILTEFLTEDDVKLVVTLSYFIEPNPGERRYANNFHYHSHSLDFKVIKPTEELEVFMRRISAPSEEEHDVGYEGSEEPWALKESIRSKGSIKKDFIVSSGADLATRNVIAVYPKPGWYKTRKKLNKSNSIVRYSLIMSIETERNDVDIYTPVLNEITNLLPIE